MWSTSMFQSRKGDPYIICFVDCSLDVVFFVVAKKVIVVSSLLKTQCQKVWGLSLCCLGYWKWYTSWYLCRNCFLLATWPCSPSFFKHHIFSEFWIPLESYLWLYLCIPNIFFRHLMVNIYLVYLIVVLVSTEPLTALLELIGISIHWKSFLCLSSFIQFNCLFLQLLWQLCRLSYSWVVKTGWSFHPSIHLFIVYLLILLMVVKSWSLYQLTLGEMQGAPWIDCQSFVCFLASVFAQR